MEMTRESISFTFDPRDMLLSLQIGFSFVRAAVACASIKRTSGLEHHLKQMLLVFVACYGTRFCSSTLIFLWMPLALFVISLVFSALMISILNLVQVLSRLSTGASSSCSSSATASMSSAYRRLVIIFLPFLC